MTVAGTRNALQRLRARPVKVIDVADPASVRAAIARHEVICNLARLTGSPQGHVGFALMAPRRRRRRALLAAIADGLAGAKPDTRLIQRSTAALYADGGNDWIAEDSPVQANDSTALASEAERVVSEHPAQWCRNRLAVPTVHLDDGGGCRRPRALRCGVDPFLAFASLASAPNTDIKVFATALGAGILLDATVVRALLLPALVDLLGRWNWWLPAPAARVLRVGQSPRPAVEET